MSRKSVRAPDTTGVVKATADEHETGVVARGFAQLPNAVLRNPRLSRDARLCYALLKSYAWNDGYTIVGQDTLARDLDCTTRSVREYIKELVTANLVTPERRGLNQTNKHYIHHNDLELRLHEDGLMSLPCERTGAEAHEGASKRPDQSGLTQQGKSQVDRKPVSDQVGDQLPVRAEDGFLSERKPTTDYVYSELQDSHIQNPVLYEDAGVPLAAQAGALTMRNAHTTWSTPQRKHPDQDYFDALGLSDPFSLPGNEQGKYLVLIEEAKKNGVCPVTLRQHLEDRGHLVQSQLSGMAEAR